MSERILDESLIRREAGDGLPALLMIDDWDLHTARTLQQSLGPSPVSPRRIVGTACSASTAGERDRAHDDARSRGDASRVSGDSASLAPEREASGSTTCARRSPRTPSRPPNPAPGLILGYMMYRTQLVPRPWPWLGLVGGPLIIISGTIVMFGGNPATATLKGPASIPEALWELVRGVYCTVWGVGARPRSFPRAADECMSSRSRN
jgi:hypothetical protein